MPTPSPPSAIWGPLLPGGAVFQVDTPLVQDATYRANPTYFAYLDSQIRGLETHVVQSLIGGLNATWRSVDASSVAINPGDVVTLAGSQAQTVTLATTAALTASGSPFGIAMFGAPPGAALLIALQGLVPPTITGLPTSGNNLYARVHNNRVQSVGSIQTSDFPLGTIDGAGNLALQIQLPPVTGTTVSITGSGVWHSTGGVLDAVGYKGTAGQILFTNVGATDDVFASSSQDVTYSATTIGQAKVVGIQTIAVPVPSGTNTLLQYNAGAFSWVSIGGTLQLVDVNHGSSPLLLSAGQRASSDSTSGTVVVNAPASPNRNDMISVKDATGTASTNNITVNGNGHTIEDPNTLGTYSTSIVMSIAGGTVDWQYDSTHLHWMVV